ncbi:MAG: AsmA family protein [Aureispira sp.]|nr:AsmA family protein [Aureispira sp.]
MRRWLKRIIITLLVLIVLLIGAAIAIPYFFKDQILEKVETVINEQLDATVDIGDVGLSILWTFPDFSFEINDLTVTGKQEFEGIKLADIGRFSFTIDVWSVFSDTYEITGVTIDDPNLYVKVLRNGKANYEIVKASDTPAEEEETTETESSGEFGLQLEYYAINNANITYDDAAGANFIEVKSLTHKGSGDFTESTYDLYTDTKIEALTVSMSRMRYFSKANVDIQFNANIESKEGGMVIKLLDNSFRFNALKLLAEGELAIGEGMAVDLKFSTPDTKFASVLSMIPGAYMKGFEDVKTNGTFAFDGYAKGLYQGNQIPSFGVNLSVENGDFQYPDLPMGIKDINTNIKVSSKSSNLDQMVVDVSKFHMKLGANPFDATLKLRTPISDPDIDSKINGTINLEELAKAFPMESIEKLTGTVVADLTTKTKMSYVNNQQYDQIDMKGLLAISDVNYNSQGLPPVLLKNMKMNFTPNNVNLEDFDIKIGKSDIKANGTLDNILTYFSRDKIMQGNLNIQSNLLDLNELMGSSEETTAETGETDGPTAATDMVDTTAAEISETGVFDRFNFGADVTVNQIVYDVYDIKNMKAKGGFSPSLAKLENFEMLMGKVDIQADGEVHNVYGYLFGGSKLHGTLNLNSNYMNLNQFMSESGEATEPVPAEDPTTPTEDKDLEPMQIPGNIDFHLTSKFNTLIYDTYNLKNAKAELRVYDHKLEIINLSANAFGGGLAFNGEYDTQNPEKPEFVLGYDLSKLDFEKIVNGVMTLQTLVPALKSLTGTFDSQLKIKGVLGKDLMPDLASLDAEGAMMTYNAVVQNMPSVEELAEKVGVKELKKLSFKNTKNFFTIKDGKFNLERFAFAHSEIDATFGGSHGLDNSMDYDLKLRVPRKLLNKNAAGQAANAAISKGFGFLKGQASKIGVDLQEAEFLNIGVDIAGTLTKPKFKVKLLGAEGKGGESLGDQVKNTIKEEAEKLKAEMEAKARAEAEKLKAEAEERLKHEADRLKAEAEELAKKQAAELAKKIKNEELKRIQDSIKNAAGKAIGDKAGDVGKNIGDKIFGGNKDSSKTGGVKNPFGGGNFNPFKKKKK